MGLNVRVERYVERLSGALDHADRCEPFRDYCTGLLLSGERKSIEPIAARVSPRRVSAAHQSLHHFVAQADWSDAALLGAVREQVLPKIERRQAIAVWIVDDTGYPKKGRHSVGVARQYCGELGKQDNCQVAVTLSVANENASLPIAYRLYLPKDWAGDAERRAKAGVPESVQFATKNEIAIAQIKQALTEGVPQGVVLTDAAYGSDSDFRDQLDQMGLTYALAIVSSTSLWPPGKEPLPPRPWRGTGRPTRLLHRSETHPPLSAKELAMSLAPQAWRVSSPLEYSPEVSK